MTLVPEMLFVVFNEQQMIMDVSSQTSPRARILYESLLVYILNNQNFY